MPSELMLLFETTLLTSHSRQFPVNFVSSVDRLKGGHGFATRHAMETAFRDESLVGQLSVLHPGSLRARATWLSACALWMAQ